MRSARLLRLAIALIFGTAGAPAFAQATSKTTSAERAAATKSESGSEQPAAEVPVEEREEKATDAEVEEWDPDAPLPAAEPDPEPQPGPTPAPDLQPEPATTPESAVPKPTGLQWSLRWRDGLQFRREGVNRVHIGGLLALDGAEIWYDDGLSRARSRGWTPEGKVRTGRVFAQGLLFRHLMFKVQYDFAASEFKDLNIGIRDVGPLPTLTVGYFKVPFSLEQTTSFRDLTFLERSLANALAPKRNSGIQATDTLFDKRVRWAIGGFLVSDALREADDLFEGSDGAWELTGRVTGIIHEEPDDRRLLLAGLSYSHSFEESGLTVSLGQRPEARQADKLLATGDISDPSTADRIGVEAAWVEGPFSIQAEAIGARFGRTDDPSLTFWGAYAQASWFPTGEHRIYGRRTGKFLRTVPKRPFQWSGKGLGAVELAARLSYLDLEDGDIRGGRELDVTLGVSWHLLSNLRLNTNAVYGRVLGEGNVWIGQMRIQADF